MHSPGESDDLRILTGSGWSATPHDYSSLRYLRFMPDGSGEAVYGYGQTIYAEIRFRFELLDGPALRLSYLSSPPFAAFNGFEPTAGNREKVIPYTLARGEYRGVESVVGWPFACEWLLTLGESPWPAGMVFRYGIPTAFYGYRRQKTSATGAQGTVPSRWWIERWFRRR